MYIVFRVDSSNEIGSGHVMRCLTLAKALRNEGTNCNFICRDHNGSLIGKIKNEGFEVHVLTKKTVSETVDEPNLAHTDWLGADWQTDAIETIAYLEGSQPDWLIVDHYALDARWEKTLRPYTQKIMVIDDLADRKHNCDLLLDQTYGIDKNKYFGLLPRKVKLLLGSKFALLRPEFHELRSAAIAKRSSGQVRNILIFFGGGDNTAYLIASIAALIRIRPNSIQTVKAILGNEDKSSIEGYFREVNIGFNLIIESYSTKIEECMLWADLAIGAGGSTSWERCCLALPTIIIELADNQKQIAHNLQQLGAAITVFKDGNLNMEIENAVIKLISDQEYYKNMAFHAANVCDGNGVKRVKGKFFYGTTI